MSSFCMSVTFSNTIVLDKFSYHSNYIYAFYCWEKINRTYSPRGDACILPCAVNHQKAFDNFLTILSSVSLNDVMSSSIVLKNALSVRVNISPVSDFFVICAMKACSFPNSLITLTSVVSVFSAYSVSMQLKLISMLTLSWLSKVT